MIFVCKSVIIFETLYFVTLVFQFLAVVSVSLLNGTSTFMDYLMRSHHNKEILRWYVTHNRRKRGSVPFPQSISLDANVIARLKFELTNYNILATNATVTPVSCEQYVTYASIQWWNWIFLGTKSPYKFSSQELIRKICNW